MRREPMFLLFGEGIDRYNWRGIWLFFATYFGAFLVAAILGPLVYLWIQGMPTPSDPDALIAYLQEKELSRYVDRVRLLFAVFLLIWLIRKCGLWGRFGFDWSGDGVRALWQFFLLGVGSLALIVLGQGYFAEPVLREGLDPGRIGEILLGAMVGGLLIGWLEEAIFRGMLFRICYTALNPIPAILLSAAVFAAVHFKGVPDEVNELTHWTGGFIVAGYQSVSVFLTVEWLDFANYFLVGLVLNLVFLRTRSLVGCMGLHAGWVFVRNTWGDLVRIPEEAATRIWGTHGIVDGVASLIILLLIAILLYVEVVRNQRKDQLGLGQVA